MAGLGGYIGYRETPLALLEGLGEFLRGRDEGLCLSVQGRAGFCMAAKTGQEPVIKRLQAGGASYYVLCRAEKYLPSAEAFLLSLYLKHRANMRRFVPFPCRYAVYDGRKRRILLGATEGRIYLWLKETGIWFADRTEWMPGGIAAQCALLTGLPH